MPTAHTAKTTIKDIAAASGVSFQTVSLALRGRPGVSDERRQHIQTIARQMGYYPQTAARMLASRQTGCIGLIVAGTDRDIKSGNWNRSVFYDFVQACEQGNRTYHIEFRYHHEDRQKDFIPSPAVGGGLVDGTILLGDVGQPLRDWLGKRAHRFVSISEPSAYCVIPDEAFGTRIALEHLHQLGHRRIAVVFGQQRYEVHKLRRQAFAKAVHELGLEVPSPSYTACFEQVGSLQAATLALDWARQLLRQKDRPTAVIGEPRAIIQAAMELNMRVPEDLSLIDWRDPIESQTTFYPPMTVIHTEPSDLMREALELLEMQLAGQAVNDKRRWLKPQLIEAQSTAKAPTLDIL